MKVREVVGALEALAPPDLAAEWDNVGLLIGDAQAEAGKLMLCIDLTDGVLAEAGRAKANMVMAYHPVIFHPIRRLTASEAHVVYAAAAGGVAVYSMHTALDAVPGGTNDVLAEVLGLIDARPIVPIVQPGGYKVVVFAPPQDASHVADAAFEAGAGRIGTYERCAFFSHGVGTFLGGPESSPSIGQAGRQEATEELRLELVAPKERLAEICSAMSAAHSYETPTIDVYPLEKVPAGSGMGRIGRLKRPVTTGTLVNRIKRSLGLRKVRLASGSRGRGGDGRGKLVSTAGCCAGASGSVFRAAAAAGATFYLTGEMRHHDALNAVASGMTVACVGHSNSERITLSRLADKLAVTLPKLKILIAARDTDPFEIV